VRKAHAITLMVVATSLAGCASHPSGTGMQMAPAGSAMALHQGMRDLWADHVVWTRNYIIAAVDGNPSAQTAATRLLKNQEDIGNAVAPYYGTAAGSKLTDLLKQHILIAVDLVAAAKANDQSKLSDANRRWHDNAAEIATFLSGANPNWSKADLQSMLNQHLSLTTQEATARLQQNWSQDQTTFDQIFDQAMSMADALSSGIIHQFPTRF
jgi:hypothetical protein